MNFVLIVIVGGVALFSIGTLNSWVQAHALSLLVGDKWIIQVQGWPALWQQVAVGFLAGAASAFALGLMISGNLAKVLQERTNKANQAAEKLLSEQREGLAKRRASIDAEIQKNVRIAIAEVNQKVENLSVENEKRRETIINLQRKNEVMVKRIAGSKRAKAARQKKAQLMSV